MWQSSICGRDLLCGRMRKLYCLRQRAKESSGALWHWLFAVRPCRAAFWRAQWCWDSEAQAKAGSPVRPWALPFRLSLQRRTPSGSALSDDNHLINLFITLVSSFLKGITFFIDNACLWAQNAASHRLLWHLPVCQCLWNYNNLLPVNISSFLSRCLTFELPLSNDVRKAFVDINRLNIIM